MGVIARGPGQRSGRAGFRVVRGAGPAVAEGLAPAARVQKNVITLTRLNGNHFVVNAELIRTIEERPDTTIVLTTGETLIVKERMDEVVARAIEYGRMVRAFVP